MTGYTGEELHGTDELKTSEIAILRVYGLSYAYNLQNKTNRQEDFFISVTWHFLKIQTFASPMWNNIQYLQSQAMHYNI